MTFSTYSIRLFNHYYQISGHGVHLHVTNPRRTTLYTGTTNNIQRRIVEHYLERGNPDTFAGKYYCYCLVWYDSFPTMAEAIAAEKYIKGKSRKWKEDLINKSNPNWNCLNKSILGEWPPKNTLPEGSKK